MLQQLPHFLISSKNTTRLIAHRGVYTAGDTDIQDKGNLSLVGVNMPFPQADEFLIRRKRRFICCLSRIGEAVEFVG